MEGQISTEKESSMKIFSYYLWFTLAVFTFIMLYNWMLKDDVNWAIGAVLYLAIPLVFSKWVALIIARQLFKLYLLLEEVVPWWAFAFVSVLSGIFFFLLPFFSVFAFAFLIMGVLFACWTRDHDQNLIGTVLLVALTASFFIKGMILFS